MKHAKLNSTIPTCVLPVGPVFSSAQKVPFNWLCHRNSDVMKEHSMSPTITYSTDPADKNKFTSQMDAFYSASAGIYDAMVKNLPVWKNWLSAVLPHIKGPRVLEVSFGTGYLLTQYAGDFEAYGIDYNERMVATARQNLARIGGSAELRQGDVEELPYESNCFDTVINTMAFSAYPDANKAMSEMHRVLKPGGILVMIDIAYPQDGNWLGVQLTRLWMTFGDLVRDMKPIFEASNFAYTDQEIGGFGSVHLYVARKG
jgi:ubiquinone/menaquinone biosynthesis C-methylase UbiE